jgi:Lon-like protease
VSGILTYALVIVAALIPVPYLIQMPGPVVNTLDEVNGTELITISGTETYEADGDLNLLTVAVAGGPERSLNASQVLRSVVAPSDTVVPTEAYYPLTTTRDDVTGQNAAEMASSQATATAAALGELDIEYDSVIAVSDVIAGSPAEGHVQAGDQIVSVNGDPIGGDEAAAQTVADTVRGADVVVLGLERDGEDLEVELEPADIHGQQMIGVTMSQTYDFPFEVTFNVDGIGGPSAGTIFALAIIDELTPGNLTGGKVISGTGAITADGTVMPIGGARQKVVAAAEAGSEYFLSPAGNCAEVLDAQGASELTVVSIDNLSDAHAAVQDIAADRTDELPSCAGGDEQR